MSSPTFSWSSLRRLVYHWRYYIRLSMKQDNAPVKAQSYSYILFTSKHRQQHRYVLADGNVAIIMLKVCTVIWHSLLSSKNPATDASSKSAIAHVGANCGTSCCTRWKLEHFHVQFSRLPRHQSVTHWEGEISEGDMVPGCQVSRFQRPPFRCVGYLDVFFWFRYRTTKCSCEPRCQFLRRRAKCSAIFADALLWANERWWWRSQ